MDFQTNPCFFMDILKMPCMSMECTSLFGDFFLPWQSERRDTMYTEYFWLLSVHVQFGVIRCIPIFNDLLSQKRLVLERNGPKFGPQRQLYSIPRVRLTVKCSCSVWGHLLHFRFLTTLYLHLTSMFKDICTETMVVNWYCTDILLSNKWPSRASRPLVQMERSSFGKPAVQSAVTAHET